ncbi:MAG: acyl-CoA dehydrogenase [Alphaproteobacteria bacterium]|jgi:alkylation response protein AidB-like acyl-CoA dehydrogenase|nr:acyl-CoA dehydrogenase [Alphaproteobacteria bacterium]MBT4086144.1 acyl-CoA dehydrogenase [Alphaproteobacteria bacterium]MBT4543761.1 acyl-CoA dehydrogenase [Alphaproteobacteria bacterium]MBT7744006.1 acyl-CoA dehydrogenase [Alphaproteobacteria bacterium]
MSDLDQFRQETREWLEANCPASMREPMSESEIVWGGRNAEFPNPDSKLWLERMGERGWTAPVWPTKYGGGGLSKDQNMVLQSELKRINARPALFSFGLWMLGPALLEFASEEQKLKFLPQIVRGEIRWCQGYSEPGAGSDLAGLQTRAVPDGDDYVINGQKVWTSYADEADWIFCLVRTDTSVKHEGISFILFDMATEGVETRPIKLISGSSPFCETFFTDVRVPQSHLVGELNAGWTIAKRLLQHERTSISNFGAVTGSEPVPLEYVARNYVGLTKDGKISDASLRDRIAAHRMEDLGFQLTLKRVAMEATQGSGPSAASSLFKSYGAKINQDRCELTVEAMGAQGLGWAGDAFSENEISATRQWLRSKGNSIEGGTSEINTNVVAKQVLGLRDHQ